MSAALALDAPVQRLAPGVEAHPITGRSDWLRLRRRDVTASDVAALMGVSPHKSRLALWMEKRDPDAVDDADSAVLRRGRLFEPAVARAVEEAEPSIALVPPEVYLRHPAQRIQELGVLAYGDDRAQHSTLNRAQTGVV